MQPYTYLDHDWFVYSRMFATAGIAKLAWDTLEDELVGKDLDLGTYRHGPSTNPGKTVTVLSHRPEGVLAARRLLRKIPGSDLDVLDHPHMGPPELEALINRRIRKVAAEARHPTGRTHEAISHGEEGARLLPDGRMVEPDS